MIAFPLLCFLFGVDSIYMLFVAGRLVDTLRQEQSLESEADDGHVSPHLHVQHPPTHPGNQPTVGFHYRLLWYCRNVIRSALLSRARVPPTEIKLYDIISMLSSFSSLSLMEASRALWDGILLCSVPALLKNVRRQRSCLTVVNPHINHTHSLETESFIHNFS